MQAKYIYYVDGKPWVPEYSDAVMSRAVPYDPTLPLVGGIDIGGGTLNPAAVVGQRGQLGDWRILAELSIADIGVDRFSDALGRWLYDLFPKVKRDDIVFYIDPAASKRDEVYEVAVEQHLRSRGFSVQLGPTNDPVARRNALAIPMGRMHTINAKPMPGFLVDKSCAMLRSGLSGKWYRKLMQLSGQERWKEVPEKTEESHVCDAASYMLSGAGEHAALTRGDTEGRQGVSGAHQMAKRRPAHRAPNHSGVAFNPFGG